MEYKTLYPWAPNNLLEETSEYNTREKIVLYRKTEHPKKKWVFGRENDKCVRVVPCRIDDPVCCDESLNPKGPFSFFYSTIFKRFSSAYPYTTLREPSSPKLIPPLPNSIQIVGRLFGVSPFSATTLAICHQWKSSYIFLKPNAWVASCGWASTGFLGEFCCPSSSNLTKASKANSSKSIAAKTTQLFWMCFLHTGLRNQDSKSPGP